MKFVEPKVFFVGETKIRRDEMNAFLKEIGTPEWESDAPSDSEYLCEVMGRLCYKSFEPGLNPNVTKVRKGNDNYLKNIITTGHGCYDDETEVLTLDGWKKWIEINKEDIFITLNTDDSEYKIEYHKSKNIIRKYYKGRMYKVKSPQVDLLVTPNHRMFVCKTSTKSGRKRNDFKIIKALDLNKDSHCYLKTTGENINIDISKTPSPIFALLGFTIGDGYINFNKIHFHIKKKRKIDYLYNIAKKLRIKIESKNDNKYILEIPEKFKMLFKGIYENKEKIIPEIFFKNMKDNKFTNDDAISLFNGLINSDGCKTKTCCVFDTTSKKLSDQFQHLCLLVGTTSNISQAKCYSDRNKSYGNKKIYRSTVISRSVKPEVNKYISYNSKTEWVDDWEGYVSCAEVPNGLLYVRRNGKPVWCGNSVLEHCSVNFIFKDVSRVFCYEPDTEILTKDGWKNITDISDNEVLLTMDPKTQMARWSKNKKIHSFNYNGNLHFFKSSQWESPSFTPDHLHWIAEYDLRRARGLSNEENVKKFSHKVPYKDLAGKRFSITHNIVMQKTLDPKEIKIGNFTYDSEDLFYFLGLVATDGVISKNKNSVGITQHKKDNIKIIKDLMTRLFNKRFKTYTYKQQIFDKDLKNWCIEKIGRINKTRRLVNLFEYSPRLLKSFYHGALLGDGNKHKQNGHEVIYCGYENLAKDWQVILAMIGRSSNIRYNDRRGSKRTLNGSVIENKLISYIISVHKKSASLVRKNHQKTKNFVGKVYCPETDDGIVYVRKHGMAFWSCNTHELVRHRAGTAISQESLRFVRLDSLSSYVPVEIRESEEGLTYFANAMSYLENAQKELAKIYDVENKDFGLKKKLTSAFRRIAPMGVATTIGWTCNLRSLRHLIESRTAPEAEREIRLVFGKVFEIVQKQYPNIFGDYMIEIIDGLPAVFTDNKKV